MRSSLYISFHQQCIVFSSCIKWLYLVLYTLALKKRGYTGLHLSVLPSVRPSVRPSVTLFRHRYLHSRLRQNVHIWYIGRQRQVVSWKLRTGILLLFILPYIYPFFFLLRFSSTISPQLYRIGSSYLVYRITTTNCIVGKIMAMSCLFFLIFVIFSFSPSNQ